MSKIINNPYMLVVSFFAWMFTFCLFSFGDIYYYGGWGMVVIGIFATYKGIFPLFPLKENCIKSGAKKK